MVGSVPPNVITIFFTFFLIVLRFFTRNSSQIRQLKFQISQFANTIAYPVTWYKEVFIIREKNKLLKILRSSSLTMQEGCRVLNLGDNTDKVKSMNQVLKIYKKIGFMQKSYLTTQYFQ